MILLVIMIECNVRKYKNTFLSLTPEIILIQNINRYMFNRIITVTFLIFIAIILTTESVQYQKSLEPARQEFVRNSKAQAKERIDKLNQADSLIFQTEKQLKEYGDKIPADKKAPIETALNELKEAHKKEDIDAVDAASKKLNEVFQAASQVMYNASSQQQGGQQAGAQPGAQPGSDGSQQKGGGDDEVTDVDFEEVKDDK